MTRTTLEEIFDTATPIIGMVHLAALPGAPHHESMDHVMERALADARALSGGGVHGIMIENFGDAPFFPSCVPPLTIAALTHVAGAVRSAVAVPIGINVLRNDAAAALAIAHTVGAAFMRVNVHTGAMLTDQGWISGLAHETLRTRTALRARVAIFADVLVKHAVAPAGLDIADAARDTWHRGLADALIVSGAATGGATPLSRVQQVRDAVPDAPILVGSGFTAATAAEVLAVANGAIVGSAFQRDGRAGEPVQTGRVEAVMKAVARRG